MITVKSQDRGAELNLTSAESELDWISVMFMGQGGSVWVCIGVVEALGVVMLSVGGAEVVLADVIAAGGVALVEV